MKAREALLILSISTVFASVYFIVFPSVDIAASRMFWDGQRFWFDKSGNGAFFTIYLHTGMRWVFFGLMAIWALRLMLQRMNSTWRPWLFVAATTAIASGLVTNIILKDHWGRARPSQIEAFGGHAQFTPAWIISDQCQRNCSFDGGDVSFAMCSLAFAFLASRHRLWAILASIGFTILVAFGRLAAGGHFLSDCVIAMLLTASIVTSLRKPFHIP